MRVNREQAFEWVRRDSGQWVSEPVELAYGLTQQTIADWRGRHVTRLEMQDLCVAECTVIYQELYWRPLHCDRLQTGLDYFAFDCGVVCGVEVARRWLQLVVGLESEAGLSKMVMAALAEKGVVELIEGMEFLRRRRHRSDPKWNVYSEAWTNRVNRAKKRAFGLVEVVNAS